MKLVKLRDPNGIVAAHGTGLLFFVQEKHFRPAGCPCAYRPYVWAKSIATGHLTLLHDSQYEEASDEAG